MSKLTHSEIQKLTKKTHDPSISLYMGVDEDFATNRERFRNLLSQVRQNLTDLTSYELKHEALYPAYRLVHNKEWWDGAKKSVAVFVAPQYLRAYHLPVEVDDKFAISRHFNVIPLLRKMRPNDSYYILALSQRNARLLWVNNHKVNELEVEEFPRSMNELNSASEDTNRSSRNYPQRKDEKPTDIFKFLHQIDNVVTPILRSQHAPLVLAGLPHIVALFKKLNHYNHIVAKSINRNVDRLSNDDLKDRAAPLVEDYFKADEKLARSQLERLVKTQPARVVKGVRKVMEAIQQGKVQTLFIDASAHIWGKLNVPNQKVTVHNRHMPGDADLLNLAISETLNHSGNVFALDKKQLPNGVNSIAILRY